MNKNNKKGDIPVLKTIIIVLVSIFIIISYLIVLVENKSFNINTITVDSQNNINDILRCLSLKNNLYIINKSKIDKNKLIECLKTKDQTSKIIFLKSKKEITLDEDNFNNKINLCNFNSETIFCIQETFPIEIYDEKTNSYSSDFLKIINIESK